MRSCGALSGGLSGPGAPGAVVSTRWSGRPGRNVAWTESEVADPGLVAALVEVVDQGVEAVEEEPAPRGHGPPSAKGSSGQACLG